MQPPTDGPRAALSTAQVVGLLRDSPALRLQGGLEILDLSLTVLADISDDLAGGSITRNSYADLHATATLQVTRQLDWGRDLVRPYVTVSDSTTSARFNLGAYHVSTPATSLAQSPPTYDVTGYDMLLRLAQPAGDAYAIAAGDSYLDKVEDILRARGYTAFIIDQSAVTTVAPGPRTWAFDDQITWLTIVNNLLGAVGYRGIWADWDGRLRCDPYIPPINRAAEWYHTDDPATTMLSTAHTVTHDYFAAPNRWVFYRTGLVEGDTPVEGDGMYVHVNHAVGPSSVQARGGLIVTKVVGVDVADQPALIVAAQRTIAADMDTPTTVAVQTAPNPLHWHFDRLHVQHAAYIADVQCVEWTLRLPPDASDMEQAWAVISQ